MTTSDSLAALAAALVKAQAAIESAPKDGTNPHFNSRFVSLDGCWSACRGPLTAHGLAILQPVSELPDGAIGITTMLLHESGEYLAETLAIKPTRDDPQGRGSAITYGRRYGLCAMVGLSPADDDAEAATDHTAPAVRATPRPAPAPRPAAPAPPGAYRVDSVSGWPLEGKRPARVTLADASGNTREVVSWDVAVISDCLDALESGENVIAGLSEKPGGVKKDGTRWPSSFELTELALQPPAGLGSPVLDHGDEGPQAFVDPTGRGMDLDIDEIPF